MMRTVAKNVKLVTLTSVVGPCFRRQFNTNGRNEGTATEKADCIVIGAGIVGIAVARQLSLKGRDVIVLETASTIGTATSSRNSEVIHAGIYYPPQSLKARLCVQGRKMLYDYCRDHAVPHKQLGKLIVATNPLQIPVLENLQRVGVENGVADLRMMEGHEAAGMEPELRCAKALWSPSTGIVDSHSLMLALQADAEEHGTTFAFNTSVVRGHASENGLHLHISETKDMHTYVCNPHAPAQIILIPKTVINSAGLSAPSLARRFHGLPAQAIPNVYYARGCYFTLNESGKVPFRHLIYPVPEDGGLGVHVTLDMGGQVRFGPDVEWLTDIDDTSSFLNMFEYTVDADRAQRFYPEIQKYYPRLRDGTLRPDYAGIRSKLSGPGEPASDFVIQADTLLLIAELSHRLVLYLAFPPRWATGLLCSLVSLLKQFTGANRLLMMSAPVLRFLLLIRAIPNIHRREARRWIRAPGNQNLVEDRSSLLVVYAYGYNGAASYVFLYLTFCTGHGPNF